MRRKIIWKIYPYYLIIILVAILSVVLYAASEMRRLYIQEVESQLEARAQILERQVGTAIDTEHAEEINYACRVLGELIETRFTVIDLTGIVLGDSDEDPHEMENHGSRPEIVTALGGEVGVFTRYSNTLQLTMMYVAVPVEEDGRYYGVVRAALPVTAIQTTLNMMYKRVALGAVIILLLATIISLVIFRRLTNPLHELQSGAEQIAAGDFSTRLPTYDTEEIGGLSDAMNHMAAQLDSRIRTIVQQSNEREAILSSMSEGVIALDNEERVISINQTAIDFFVITEKDPIGKNIQELIRSVDIHDFVQESLTGGDIVERELKIRRGSVDHYLQAHGSALKDFEGSQLGVVLVFNDVTKLRRLENVRRDFVANVSHELRTPITAIRGFVETLLDDGAKNSDDVTRFLKIIDRHTGRLNNIVDDLLTLSRLESDAEQLVIELTEGDLCRVLDKAVAACDQKLSKSQISVDIHCPPGLKAKINADKLEQAIVNLLDNAIKYSETDSRISIVAAAKEREITISVEDEGSGIEEKHLPRLFERFYRVDYARSREMGGTGLGLAIVKHIAIAHGGSVSVESIPGHGSTFHIHLPKA